MEKYDVRVKDLQYIIILNLKAQISRPSHSGTNL